MKFIDAIKTGMPFRLSGYSNWIRPDFIATLQHEDGQGAYNAVRENVLDGEWEVAEPIDWVEGSHESAAAHGFVLSESRVVK